MKFNKNLACANLFLFFDLSRQFTAMPKVAFLVAVVGVTSLLNKKIKFVLQWFKFHFSLPFSLC
jgi:hypothetical protein